MTDREQAQRKLIEDMKAEAERWGLATFHGMYLCASAEVLEDTLAEPGNAPQDRVLPCGCVLCVCSSDVRCSGCGACESEACRRSRLSGGPCHAPAPVKEAPRCGPCGREMFTSRHGNLLRVDWTKPCTAPVEQAPCVEWGVSPDGKRLVLPENVKEALCPECLGRTFHKCGDSTCGCEGVECWKCNGTGRAPGKEEL